VNVPQLVGRLVSVLLTLLSKDLIKTIIDSLLDEVENIVARSSNPIDDTVILPLCTLIRNSLDIPDND
jgi:hypothetical protein